MRKYQYGITTVLILLLLIIFHLSCSRPSDDEKDPSNNTFGVKSATTPEAVYRIYWSAWKSATSHKDLYVYRGGPQFEKEKKEIESDPKVATAGFTMFKMMTSGWHIDKIVTVSQDKDRSKLLVHITPRNPGDGSSTGSINVTMVRIKNKWLIESEHTSFSTRVSDSINVGSALKSEKLHEEKEEKTHDLTEGPIRIDNTTLDGSKIDISGFEPSALEMGSTFVTLDNEYEATKGIVVYNPEKELLSVKLFGYYGDYSQSEFEFTLKAFPGLPGVYTQWNDIYIIDIFSEQGISCLVRRTEWGERPPDDLSLEEATVLGEFKAYFASYYVHVFTPYNAQDDYAYSE